MSERRLRHEPHPSRFPTGDTSAAAAVVAAHATAVEAGEAGYLDPVTGLFVFTAAHHLARGSCCESGCRHCPWVWDDDSPADGGISGG